MAKITLKDAFYTPFSDEFVGKTIAQSELEIKEVLAQHKEMIGENAQHCYSDIDHHYFCSTMMDSVFSADSMSTKQIINGEANVPQSFTNAYECACWGYCLRYHLESKQQSGLLAISILDINSMEMSYWSQNEQWGKSGFGVTTLVFEVQREEVGSMPIHNGVASGGNNIISFASFAKQTSKQTNAKNLSLPFFPDSMSIPVRRSLKDVQVLTERHSEYGHAFGSDPWIAFIRDHAEQNFAGDQILFGSLALRGYYCFAHIDIASDVNTHHLPLRT